jgi:23S rRNA (guanosine2251-2'-O)-methyltransferase
MNNKRDQEGKREDRNFKPNRNNEFVGRRERVEKNKESIESHSRQERREESENIIEGRNPVIEVMKSSRTVEKLLIAKGNIEGSIKMIVGMAKDKGIVISEVDRKKLDDMSSTGSHQGVIAIVSPYTYFTIDQIFEYAKEKDEDPFIIILDEIEDPHNLGSIVRSANVCGAHGVIIPKRRSALVTSTVAKASAGAVEHTRIAKVTNINQTIKELKDRGVWVAGTDMDGEVSYKANLKGPIAIVVGSEGKGISKLVRENCDLVISIPMKGEINSLNASVAAGIMMYEVLRQRGSQK